MSNPETLVTMMTQEKVPERLLYTTSQPYTLYVNPPPGSVLSAVQPPPNGAAAAGVRAWSVRQAGVVATDLVDEHRQNLAEVVQQIMLILAGFFFGLFASTTPWAVRGLRLGMRSARA
ncbi:hypothetical protein [Kribbella sp. NPDC000426]|uniref:hypothetical protein n=1 Tax=Kribbella sp. NPDC000426 TaxID=3154255 RepID=UPI0033267420